MMSPSSHHLLQQWLHDSEVIASIDPLLFDERLVLLHLLNKAGDTKEMVQLLYRTLPVPDVLDAYTYHEAVAAMRDLGIFIGILKKHGIEPVEVVPELEYVLLVLMVKTDLPPRDTLLHYTSWNPDGKRIRSYTGLADEIALIESVKMAMPTLMESIVMLEAMHEHALHGDEFVMNCQRLHKKMEGMVNGIVHAKKNVAPAVFANELRFYYDPIKVDYNKDYIGPGAVEMPMFVFDHLLWNCDCPDPVYTAFKEGYLPYNMRFIRDIYWRFKGKPSLLSRIEENLTRHPSHKTYKAAQAALDLCMVLKSFRMPHKKLARQAYEQGEKQHHTKGSGGYSTEILDQILHLQQHKLAALQNCVDRVKVNVLS